MSRLRIAFFLRHPFHKPILLPIADGLRDRHDILVSAEKWDLIDFNPHIIVAGESLRAFRFHYYLPFTLFVHTRHGLASKGVAVQSASFSHYTCVTSLSMQHWYREQGVHPRRGFWVTGYPQMDPLFHEQSASMPESAPAHAKVVLYAPTFQFGLTSVRMLGERAIDLLQAGRNDVFVVIKPHPLIAKHHPDWLAWIKAEAGRRNGVYVTGDADCDLMPFLKRADLLVTDASSAMLEYLALDRPMVLITNPEREREHFYDPAGFEWRWRDMGTEVFDIEDLPSAIDSGLNNPALHQDRRRKYRAKLFSDLADGNAAQRVALRIDRLRHETAGAMAMALSAYWSRTCRAFLRRRGAATQTAGVASV